MNLLYNNRPSQDQEFISKICYNILNEKVIKKEESNKYCAIFVEGRNREIGTLEDLTALTSFKIFSEKNYPIFCFLNNTNSPLLNSIAELYRINIIPIKTLNTLQEYSNFMINEVFFKIPNYIHGCLTIQPDGFLLKSGWENFIEQNNINLIGAKWGHYTFLDVLYNETYIPMAFPPTNIGNLGFSYRNPSICRLISEKFKNITFKQHWDQPGHLPEDAFYCYLTYGMNICKKPTEDQANQFSIDPLTNQVYSNKNDLPFGFHYFKYV